MSTAPVSSQISRARCTHRSDGMRSITGSMITAARSR
jgi:hypothetical protein